MTTNKPDYLDKALDLVELIIILILKKLHWKILKISYLIIGIQK